VKPEAYFQGTDIHYTIGTLQHGGTLAKLLVDHYVLKFNSKVHQSVDIYIYIYIYIYSWHFKTCFVAALLFDEIKSQTYQQVELRL